MGKFEDQWDMAKEINFTYFQILQDLMSHACTNFQLLLLASYWFSSCLCLMKLEIRMYRISELHWRGCTYVLIFRGWTQLTQTCSQGMKTHGRRTYGFFWGWQWVMRFRSQRQTEVCIERWWQSADRVTVDITMDRVIYIFHNHRQTLTTPKYTWNLGRMPNDRVHYHEQLMRNISSQQYNMCLKADVALTVRLLNAHFMRS